MNKDALEAGVPHRRVRDRSEGPRSSRSPVSSLEGPAAQRASTLSGILERRRAAERQMADVFSALPEPAERVPARVTGERVLPVQGPSHRVLSAPLLMDG